MADSIQLEWRAYSDHDRNIKEFVIDGYSWRAEFFPNEDDQVTLAISLKNILIFLPRLVTISVDQNSSQPKTLFQRAFNFRLGKALYFPDILDERRGSHSSLNMTIEKHCEIIYSISVPPSNLSTEFSSLLSSGHLSDVKICADDLEFNAHKIILSAKSPVFKVMFSHETTKESTENVVNISDFEGDIIQKMLHFMYSDEVDFQDMTPDKWITLYQAADKYQMDRLKVICENMLLSNLTVDSVLEIWVLADLHRSYELIEDAKLYIITNFDKIYTTIGWNKFLKENTSFIDKLISFSCTYAS